MAKSRYNIAVFGSWGKELPIESYKAAEMVGKIIAKIGHRLVCGANTGVAEWAIYGAKSELDNSKSQEIRPVMVVPASSSDMYPFVGKVRCDELLVGSGTDSFGVAGEQRKMLKLTDSSFVNGGIVIGGGVGTMLESLGCYHNGIPIVVLKNSGWAAEQLQNLVSEDHFINDGKMLAKICFEDNAENVVEKIIELIKIGGSRDSHSLGIEKAMTSPLDYYSK